MSNLTKRYLLSAALLCGAVGACFAQSAAEGVAKPLRGGAANELPPAPPTPITVIMEDACLGIVSSFIKSSICLIR